MSEANNYVCFNVDQSGNHSEPTRLRARNNIGAAGLSSLAESFESRAPSYAWSVGEVCAYGGKLWQFDADHSGAWTGADAHEVTNIANEVSFLYKNLLFEEVKFKSYNKYDTYLDQAYKTRIFGYKQNDIYFISGAFRLYANPNLQYEISDGCGLVAWPALFYIELPSVALQDSSSFTIFSASDTLLNQISYIRVGVIAGENRVAISFNANAFNSIEIPVGGKWFNFTCAFLKVFV